MTRLWCLPWCIKNTKSSSTKLKRATNRRSKWHINLFKKWRKRWQRCTIINRRKKRKMTTPTSRSYNATKENKIQCTKEGYQSQCITIMQTLQAGGTPFRKIFFELKENEERRPPRWKTRVKWNKTETKIFSGKQCIKSDSNCQLYKNK